MWGINITRPKCEWNSIQMHQCTVQMSKDLNFEGTSFMDAPLSNLSAIALTFGQHCHCFGTKLKIRIKI